MAACRRRLASTARFCCMLACLLPAVDAQARREPSQDRGAAADQAHDPVRSEALVSVEDPSTRLTIAVMVNGRGPYPFVVDSGATRTVISQELAALLRLPAGPRIVLDDALGRVGAATAIIDRLQIGSREIARIVAPVLSAANLGADGMIGIDSLRDQLVVLDFDTRRFVIGRSAEDAYSSLDTTIVFGRKRFGQLVLVDADSHAAPIFVILDTGAQRTIGNPALRRLLTSGTLAAGQIASDTLLSVTGNHAQVDIDLMPEIRLGGITINNMPIVYADLHTFSQFGLHDQPALLLGMDVLHLFHRVAIDFRRGQATFVGDR